VQAALGYLLSGYQLMCTDVKDPDAHRQESRARQGEGHVIGGVGGRQVTSRGVERNGGEVTSQSDEPRAPRSQSIKTGLWSIRESPMLLVSRSKNEI